MSVFGQTLLHLVELQRMGQKGGAHSQISDCHMPLPRQVTKTCSHYSLSLTGRTVYAVIVGSVAPAVPTIQAVGQGMNPRHRGTSS